MKTKILITAVLILSGIIVFMGYHLHSAPSVVSSSCRGEELRFIYDENNDMLDDVKLPGYLQISVVEKKKKKGLIIMPE